MSTALYTALTFAPVQGFIERSRKLRDLYGSSFILSYLSRSLCEAGAEYDCELISPALLDITQGTPNQIIFRGHFPLDQARNHFVKQWKQILRVCREWLELTIPATYTWKRDWELWGSHAWEFFGGQGATITAARQAVNNAKRCRDWTGINWSGESSTLSGTDAIAWPGLGRQIPQQQRNLSAEKTEIQDFYGQLHEKVGALIDPNEELSIPELVKRLINFEPIAKNLNLKASDRPAPFREINRFEENLWTGWFQGDGDRIGEHLQRMGGTEEAQALKNFSQAMLRWGKTLSTHLPRNPTTGAANGLVIFAGGDDFLGVLYSHDPGQALTGADCMRWFQDFPKQVWATHQQPITVSVGFVWAAPGVPQRDVLQHCREAEQAAKTWGRDRLAIRILFNSGTHLEWVCPWSFLGILKDYRDRTGGQNWNHLFRDVAQLKARHAFENNHEVALALLELYFPGWQSRLDWDKILPPRESKASKTQWILDMAAVGFHLSA